MPSAAGDMQGLTPELSMAGQIQLLPAWGQILASGSGQLGAFSTRGTASSATSQGLCTILSMAVVSLLSASSPYPPYAPAGSNQAVG